MKALEFALVAASAGVLESLSPSTLQTWHALGGQHVVIKQAPAMAPSRPGVLRVKEAGRLFSGWLDGYGIVAAIVRPDRAVFGGARDANELNALIEVLATQRRR